MLLVRLIWLERRRMLPKRWMRRLVEKQCTKYGGSTLSPFLHRRRINRPDHGVSPAGWGADAPPPFKRFLCSCRTCREAHNNIILADCLVAQWQNSFKKFSFVEFCIHKNIFLRTTRCVLFPHRTTNVDNKYSALTWWWKRRARLNKSVCTCIWLKRLWGLGQLSPGRLWPQQGSSVKVRSVAFCPTGPKYPIIGKGREHRLSGRGL